MLTCWLPTGVFANQLSVVATYLTMISLATMSRPGCRPRSLPLIACTIFAVSHHANRASSCESVRPFWNSVANCWDTSEKVGRQPAVPENSYWRVVSSRYQPSHWVGTGPGGSTRTDFHEFCFLRDVRTGPDDGTEQRCSDKINSGQAFAARDAQAVQSRADLAACDFPRCS